MVVEAQQMDAAQALIQRFRSKDATIAVVGLGSVGIPIAAAFARAGFGVIGLDIDEERVAALGRGEKPLAHLDGALVDALCGHERFEVTSDERRLADAHAKIVCVPTPLGPHREPDLSKVEAAVDAIARSARPGQLVVLESTTYPGTTRTIVAERLRRAGLRPGEDCFVAFSPEREDPGRQDWSTRTTPKLVGGIDERSADVACALYEQAVREVVRTSSSEVAEAAKLLENVYRAVNIALVNELKVVLDAMQIDVWEVIEAASTKPFGFTRFTPGPGMGGHCIPVDPFYLTWAARRFGLSTKFIELAGEINRRMPLYVVERAQAALNSIGKAVKGARVLVLGLAYKPEVSIVTESPSLVLLAELARLGAQVAYSDPFVPVPPAEGVPQLVRELRSVDLDAATLAEFDAVVLATHHAALDLDLVATHARLVVDTRNALASRMLGDARYFRA